MAKAFSEMEDSNRSSNPSIHDVSDPARRTVLRSGFGAAAASLFGPWLPGCAAGPRAGAPGPQLGFQGVPPSAADALVVPKGHVAEVLARWGDPVGIAGAQPAWRETAYPAPHAAPAGGGSSCRRSGCTVPSDH